MQRRRMVSEQLIKRGIADHSVLNAMGEVPRHHFISESFQEDSYGDTPLPIGAGQTISQPYIVALMTELLKITSENIVLEVGTGSGYQAAVLARIAQRVFSVESVPELASAARKILDHLQIANVEIHERDGGLGLPEKAPFDAILVAAGSPRTPEPLLNQLTDDGRLIIPVGSRNQQHLQLWTMDKGKPCQSTFAPVRFVPLLGKWGWEE